MNFMRKIKEKMEGCLRGRHKHISNKRLQIKMQG